jgi:xanthine dehydrogenase/oxidase
MAARYKLGFTKDGKIQALEIDMYSNAGNSLDLSASVMDRALFHMDNCYLIPNIRGTGFTCKTNLPTNTAFRGFGGPQVRSGIHLLMFADNIVHGGQGMFFAENWVSDIGRVLGMPQDRVRELNFYQEGSLTHYNQELIHNQVCSCVSFSLYDTDTQWHGSCPLFGRRPKPAVTTPSAARRLPSSTRNTNLSSAAWQCIFVVGVFPRNSTHFFFLFSFSSIPTKFGIAFTASFLNQAGALVLVYTDGSVLLTHGGTEMGQGLNTKMIQVRVFFCYFARNQTLQHRCAPMRWVCLPTTSTCSKRARTRCQTRRPRRLRRRRT